MIRIRLNKVIGQYLEEELPEVVEAAEIIVDQREKKIDGLTQSGDTDLVADTDDLKSFLLKGDMEQLEHLMSQLSYLDQDD